MSCAIRVVCRVQSFGDAILLEVVEPWIRRDGFDFPPELCCEFCGGVGGGGGESSYVLCMV